MIENAALQRTATNKPYIYGLNMFKKCSGFFYIKKKGGASIGFPPLTHEKEMYMLSQYTIFNACCQDNLQLHRELPASFFLLFSSWQDKPLQLLQSIEELLPYELLHQHCDPKVNH